MAGSSDEELERLSGTTAFHDHRTGEQVMNWIGFTISDRRVRMWVAGPLLTRRPRLIESASPAVVLLFRDLVALMRTEAWASRRVIPRFKDRRPAERVPTTCPGCGGSGDVEGFVCPRCDGARFVLE